MTIWRQEGGSLQDADVAPAKKTNVVRKEEDDDVIYIGSDSEDETPPPAAAKGPLAARRNPISIDSDEEEPIATKAQPRKRLCRRPQFAPRLDDFDVGVVDDSETEGFGTRRRASIPLHTCEDPPSKRVKTGD
jgi:hypothetical protein